MWRGTLRLGTLLCLAGMCVLLAGCGGGGSTDRQPILQPPVSVTLSPRAVGLTFTQTQQFSAVVLNSSNPQVNWTVDGVAGGNAGTGTISSSGLYTPPQGTGSHTITATSVAEPGKSASASAIITDFPGTFTYHNDNFRTGQNLQETVLTPTNVNQAQFGKRFSLAVDGYVYGEPLYVENVNVPGQGFHNLVFAVTEHDSVYAFDADGRSSSPIWQVSFINPALGITTVPSGDVLTGDIVPEIGITGTPVIDPAGGILYVVAKTKENGSYVQRLHALDIATGAEVATPALIAPVLPGTGDGNDGNGNVPFNSLRQNQRCGLLLANGTVYVAWASHGDRNPYHGWVVGYNAVTLQQVSAYDATTNGSEGGIWHSGGGPAADENGNVYVVTGNGTFDVNLGGVDLGDSFLKLSPTLALLDFFTPFNQAQLQAGDVDLGSGGPLLLPDQATAPAHLLLAGGKQGVLYLLDRDDLGQFNPVSDSQIVQRVPAAVGPVYLTPAYWNNVVYFISAGDVLKSFTLNNGRLPASASAQATTAFPFPGATPVVSANGNSAGIVWAVQTDAFHNNGPAVLHAWDATNVSHELYNSTQAGSRDTAGPAVKFSVPTVANGKVYIGTENSVDVYGLLP